MDITLAEQWYHYGVDEPHIDIRVAADAILRLYIDGSTVWKTRQTLHITPNIWEDVGDLHQWVTID